MRQGQHRSKKDSRRNEYHQSREYKDIHNAQFLAADDNNIILFLKQLYHNLNKILKEDKFMMFNIILCIFLGFFQHMEGTEQHVIPMIDDIVMHHRVEKNNEVTKNNIAMIVESYKKIVAEHVDSQTLSWNRHLSLERDNRPLSERKKQISIINNTSPELTRIKQMVQSSIIGSDVTTMFRRHVGSNGNDSDNIIIWDDEKDIPLYFETLINNCGRDASEASFNQKCWGFLNNLVENPRCTVRLDSRFQCRQRSWSHYGVKMAEKMDLTIEDLIKDHFLNDTINIVIIGAGPIGLGLANALTTMVSETRTQHDSDNDDDDYDIRIIVFENRNDTPGLKRPYDRDWVTDLDPENFRVFGDSRLNDFFDLMLDTQSSGVNDDILNQNEDYHYQYYYDDNTNSDRIHLPIKAIETLLLLSNRDRGVKFIYEDFQSYETNLTSSFDNIIIFDATGHRLHRDGVSVEEQERQQPNVITTTSIVTIERSFNDNSVVTSDDYDMLVETNNGIQVMEKRSTAATDGHYDGFYDDTVLYPASLSGGTTPYDIHFLKISDIRDMDDSAWNTLNWMADEASKSATDSACDTVCVNRDGQRLCLGAQWCQLYFLWEYTGLYRTDIAERMSRDHPGFSQTVMFLNLSPQQADAFSFILSHNATTKTPSSSRVRLSHLPINEMTTIPTFQENGLDVILEHLTEFSNPQNAIVDLFTYRPYMYPDPSIRDGVYGDQQRQQVQPLLLRIGDSLFSGDPNISTGLDNHLWIIRRLVEDLRVRRYRSSSNVDDVNVQDESATVHEVRSEM